ncbi:MAG: glycosyltransferase, partial [Geminicoccaceae bacterium]|nr:glycosyltransferase [Geminicoccaceae bacterium]
LVHVHGLEAARFARFELGIAAERLVIVPHGNYRPRFAPLAAPREGGRAALGLPEEARVVLLFGRLDAYKGIDELLDAIGRLDRPELWLLIAGQQVVRLDEPLARLPPAVRQRIVVEPGPVPEARIPLLFHAADALVAPYRRILTSGAAMLALSLGRPVLAPAHPGLAELVRDGNEGLLWEPADPAGLERTLERFLALDAAALEQLAAGAAARAELFDWRTIGNLMAGVFGRLLALRRPLRRLLT